MCIKESPIQLVREACVWIKSKESSPAGFLCVWALTHAYLIKDYGGACGRFRLWLDLGSCPNNNPRVPFIRPVSPSPVGQHDQPVSEAYQEVDVDEEPEQPGGVAGEFELAYGGDGGVAAYGGE